MYNVNGRRAIQFPAVVHFETPHRRRKQSHVRKTRRSRDFAGAVYCTLQQHRQWHEVAPIRATLHIHAPLDLGVRGHFMPERRPRVRSTHDHFAGHSSNIRPTVFGSGGSCGRYREVNLTAIIWSMLCTMSLHWSLRDASISSTSRVSFTICTFCRLMSSHKYSILLNKTRAR